MNAAKKITFQSFTERVAKRTKVSGIEADAYIHQLAKTAGHALEKGDEVQLYHFGRFRTTHVDERPGSNPHTGEALTVPDHTRVDFQPYKALMIAVNWPFRHLRTKMLTEKETGTRPSAIAWLLLALALLALILVGIYLNNRMASLSSVTAVPAAVPANIETQQPAIESTPIVAATVTDTAIDTEAGAEIAASTDAATDAATNAPIEPIAAANIVVATGDTLWGISQSQWGDSSWWPVIYAENRAKLAGTNPDFIETGSLLHIPVLAGSVDQPTDADVSRYASAYRIVADDYAQLGHPRAAEYRLFVNRRFDAL